MDRLTSRLMQTEKALSTLAEVIASDTPSAIERDAAIHRFKYCVELSWKLAREYLLVLEGLDLSSPKSVIRAFREKSLISTDETVEALHMIDDRNLTSHTYDEAFAEEIYRRLPGHYRTMTTLVNRIKIQIEKNN